jgi:flagellar motor component MotA
MTRNEFVNKYTEIVELALQYSEKTRREGLLALEHVLDREKIDERDILEYGLSFVVDGIDEKIIEKTLSNIIKQEKDEYMIILKNIQKEAVLMIQQGANTRLLYVVLNSYTDIRPKEDQVRKNQEGL